MSKYITKPIGEVAQIRRGASPRPIDEWMSESGVPWVKIADATKQDSRFIYSTEGYIREEGKDKSVEVFPEDLIISNSASPGIPRIMKIHACIHDGWLLVSNFNGVTRDYLFYQINFLRRYLVKKGNGSIFTNLKTDILKEFPIRIPIDENGNFDEREQSRIVGILIDIEDKIENNRSIVSDLESLAKQIYDYWFVQFDFPDDRGLPYKSSGGKMVWNDKLKRYIPAAWDVVKLGDICESMIAGDWGKSEPTGNYTKEVFCIRGADIPDVQCGSKGKMPTRYILPNNFETKRLTENNLVVEISGGSPIQSTGRIAIVTKQLLDLYDNRIICTNFCKALKIKSECVYLIYFMWRSLYDNRQMFSFEIGTTGIKNLDIAYILENVYIAIPPQNLLNSFNQRIEKFLNCMFSSSHENESLTSLRDFLLPMLMNGQVTVNDI